MTEEQVTRLNDTDVKDLEITKLKRQLALKTAEREVSESKAVDFEFRYFVLQLYMKYGLNPTDALDEQGNIHRGVNK